MASYVEDATRVKFSNYFRVKSMPQNLMFNRELDLNSTICVVGLGYVGLPLAMAFSKLYKTIGFDTNEDRISELSCGFDRTGEADELELRGSESLVYTSSLDALKAADIYVVTVPTPVDKYKRPNLKPLQDASRAIGEVLSPGNLVIYESTVYPGATEEECVPYLESESKLTANVDFYYGYSPERINPGDKNNRLESIVKLTSGSCELAALEVDALYKSIISAGTHLCSSVRVAEAAKVIENTQRDVNIAFVNELSILFDKLDLDVNDVLDAACTKWNFLNFRPGLVGGHCIGVDPYYLTHKSQASGYYSEIISVARRVNDSMAEYAVSKVVRKLMSARSDLRAVKLLIMGLTFKENCPDTRNSKVFDILRELDELNIAYDIYDPHADASEVHKIFGLEILSDITGGIYDAALVTVAHNKFKDLGVKGLRKFLRPGGMIFDLKAIYARADVDLRL